MTVPADLDHLVYATPDLEATVGELAERLGVQPASGGSHPGRGTRNFLLSLGEDSYLEVIGADDDQAPPAAGRPFGLDRLQRPRLVTWAVRVDRLEERIATAQARGWDPGEIQSMSRRQPDGSRLEWRLALPRGDLGGGLVPFLIDWGGAPSPARSSPAGCSLVALRAEHPEPETVASALRALDVDLELVRGPKPALLAEIRGASRRVTIG